MKFIRWYFGILTGSTIMPNDYGIQYKPDWAERTMNFVMINAIPVTAIILIWGFSK